MTSRYVQPAPMPDSIRHFMRAGQHPARAVDCPHCGAAAHKPCRIPSRGIALAQVHQQRITARARLVACCPTCQVTPTIPCHTSGRELAGGAVHAARYAEADRSAA